jgi:hypothetical protein
MTDRDMFSINSTRPSFCITKLYLPFLEASLSLLLMHLGDTSVSLNTGAAGANIGEGAFVDGENIGLGEKSCCGSACGDEAVLS